MRVTQVALVASFALCASCNYDAPQRDASSPDLDSSSASVATGQPKGLPGEDLIPQARPVYTWLEAVKNSDTKLLKSVFSESMQKTLDEEGWPNVLKIYQEVFNNEFADYKLEDFAFEFDGGEERGTVSIVHKSKKLPGLRVLMENGVWKVDER